MFFFRRIMGITILLGMSFAQPPVKADPLRQFLTTKSFEEAFLFLKKTFPLESTASGTDPAAVEKFIRSKFDFGAANLSLKRLNARKLRAHHARALLRGMNLSEIEINLIYEKLVELTPNWIFLLNPATIIGTIGFVLSGSFSYFVMQELAKAIERRPSLVSGLQDALMQGQITLTEYNSILWDIGPPFVGYSILGIGILGALISIRSLSVGLSLPHLARDTFALGAVNRENLDAANCFSNLIQIASR